MPKLLIIITSEGTPEIPEIWPHVGLQHVPDDIERSIIVVNGVEFQHYNPDQETHTWAEYVAQAFGPHQQNFTNGVSIGVVYHRVTVNLELEQAIRTYFNGRTIELRDFSGGGRGENANAMWRDLYVPLATAARSKPQEGTEIARAFDSFWYDRFGNPILRTLCAALDLHAALTSGQYAQNAVTGREQVEAIAGWTELDRKPCMNDGDERFRRELISLINELDTP